MACELERPTPQTLFNRYRDMFSVTVLGGAPIVPESNEWYVVALEYAVAEEFYSIAEQQWKERDPRYACCDNLIELARLDGVFPRAASFASGYGTITGTAGSALPSEIEASVNGVNFVTASVLPSQMPASGSLIVRFQAVEPGEAANTPTLGTGSITGTLTTPIPGISNTVTFNGGTFCGGAEAETCEAFRSRYLARKAYKPLANRAWIEEKLLEWPCVTRICERGGTCCNPNDPCNCLDCPKQHNFHVFMDNTFECGIVPECVLTEISTWLFGDPQGYGLGQMPIGICGKLYPVTGVKVNLEIVGSGCFTDAQRSEIIARMQEFFATLCPSTVLSQRAVECIVGNVVGPSLDYQVYMTPEEDSEGLNKILEGGCCDDLEMACDVLACLGDITFEDTPFEVCRDASTTT